MAVTFADAMTKTNDTELSDLLAKARVGMNGWSAVARFYQSMNELHYQRIETLKFKSVRVGKRVQDMDLCFQYGNLTTFYCA